MNGLWQYVCLLGVHWFADFVVQTHWQASNKSKNAVALSRHVTSYTLVLAAASALLFGPHVATIHFVVWNGALHFVTDFITSRITSRLYQKQDWHNFFAVIGFDQLIHQVTLAGTMWLIFVW